MELQETRGVGWGWGCSLASCDTISFSRRTRYFFKRSNKEFNLIQCINVFSKQQRTFCWQKLKRNEKKKKKAMKEEK